MPTDHWALIATARLLQHCASERAAFRETLIRHAVQVCYALLRGQGLHAPVAGLRGAYDVFGRTAPAATRLEGLLAALEFLPLESGRLRGEIEDAVTSGIAFLLRAQIGSGPYAGGMPGAYGVCAPGGSEVRIDYVQHAMCAWLQYRKLFQSLAATRDVKCMDPLA